MAMHIQYDNILSHPVVAGQHTHTHTSAIFMFLAVRAFRYSCTFHEKKKWAKIKQKTWRWRTRLMCVSLKLSHRVCVYIVRVQMNERFWGVSGGAGSGHPHPPRCQLKNSNPPCPKSSVALIPIFEKNGLKKKLIESRERSKFSWSSLELVGGECWYFLKKMPSSGPTTSARTRSPIKRALGLRAHKHTRNEWGAVLPRYFHLSRFRINVYIYGRRQAVATRQQIKHFYGVKNQHKNESTPKKNKRRTNKKSTNVCLRASVFLLLRRWFGFEKKKFNIIFFWLCFYNHTCLCSVCECTFMCNVLG